MSIPISYMGTKRQISPFVASVVGSAKQGTFLDAFSGMCAVGEAIAPTRQIWNSDAQVFAYSVAHALFVSQSMVPTQGTTLDKLREHFQRNSKELFQRFKKRLKSEEATYAEHDLARLTEYLRSSRHVANSDIDALYNSTSRKITDHRAVWGDARSFMKFSRNAFSHAPTTQAEMAERMKKCKKGFLDSLDLINKLTIAISSCGYRIKLH